MGMFALSVSIITAASAVAVAAWAWFAMRRVEEELRSFAGFESMHFEI
jgi:hypothetical protein